MECWPQFYTPDYLSDSTFKQIIWAQGYNRSVVICDEVFFGLERSEKEVIECRNAYDDSISDKHSCPDDSGGGGGYSCTPYYYWYYNYDCNYDYSDCTYLGSSFGGYAGCW